MSRNVKTGNADSFMPNRRNISLDSARIKSLRFVNRENDDSGNKKSPRGVILMRQALTETAARHLPGGERDGKRGLLKLAATDSKTVGKTVA